MKTAYTNLYEITALQQKIVRYIDYWVHIEKEPISQKEIIREMVAKGENNRSVEYALHGLENLKYIRRALDVSSRIVDGKKGSGNSTRYVQLRRL